MSWIRFDLLQMLPNRLTNAMHTDHQCVRRTILQGAHIIFPFLFPLIIFPQSLSHAQASCGKTFSSSLSQENNIHFTWSRTDLKRNPKVIHSLNQVRRPQDGWYTNHYTGSLENGTITAKKETFLYWKLGNVFLKRHRNQHGWPLSFIDVCKFLSPRKCKLKSYHSLVA